MQFHVASILKLSKECHVFAAVGDFAFRHLVMKIDRTFGTACHFVYNYKISIIHEEYGTTVFQVLVTRVFGNQSLDGTFRLPQFGNRFCSIQVLVVQRYCVVYTSLTVPVALFHHFAFTCIYIRTGIREQVLAVEPKFECTVVRLTVPECFRTSFYYHLSSIRSPGIAEHEET